MSTISFSFDNFTPKTTFSLVALGVLGIGSLGTAFLLSHLQLINQGAYLSCIGSGAALLGIELIAFMIVLCKKPPQTVEKAPISSSTGSPELTGLPAVPSKVDEKRLISKLTKTPIAGGPSTGTVASPTKNVVDIPVNSSVKETDTSFLIEDEL